MWEFAGDHPVWFLVYLLALLLVVAVTLTAVAASVQRIFETKYKALSDVARAWRLPKTLQKALHHLRGGWVTNAVKLVEEDLDERFPTWREEC